MPNEPRPANSRRWMRITVVAAVIALFAALVLTMPRGFQTDLTLVGDGRPALVLVYDNSLVISDEQMAALDRVRSELEPRMHLLAADVNHPDGLAFMDEHRGQPGMLLLFGPDGQLVERIHPPVPANRIRDRVGAVLGPKP